MLTTGDEVGEGIDLLHHPAGLPPLFPKFATTADMGDDIDHAAIEQGQPRGRKARWN
jgi:hypothetical protein